MHIALVEYLNTLPFSEGLHLTGTDQVYDLHRVTPAQCAVLYQQGAVDVSLCPVGALPDMPSYEIVGNYCIGADGPVKTVMLFSHVPIERISAVQLDSHSRTSNLLLQVLAERYWKKHWTYVAHEQNGHAESCVMIGDKVFEHAARFSYQYDLAEAWKALTGLPMVFAVWIARPGTPAGVAQAIDKAFEAGMEAILSGQTDLAAWQRDYLTQSISYPLDSAKREALHLFSQWSSALVSSGAIS